MVAGYGVRYARHRAAESVKRIIAIVRPQRPPQIGDAPRLPQRVSPHISGQSTEL